MPKKDVLYKQYRSLLSDGVIPFWLRYGVDREFGGVLFCMQEDGTPISTDKYIWSQARFVWVMSALYNRIESRPEFLEIARRTIDSLAVRMPVGSSPVSGSSNRITCGSCR